MAVFWAAVNMIFAAFNDMVFKGYARKPRSHGFFIAIVGVIFGITAACLVTEPVNWRATLIWGAISGFFSVGGNILMLDAMRKLDAGICATIYRLNLVPAVLLACFFLAEPITLLQWGGIVCACLAVLAFMAFCIMLIDWCALCFVIDFLAAFDGTDVPVIMGIIG